MGPRRSSRILLLAMVAALALLSVWAAQPARAAATRIMPLGDSITGSPGCWRSLLWNRLQSSGYTNIDFVGTLGPQGCGLPYDGDNEGHGGYLATNVANQNMLPAWLAATNPDIVLMHFATNDVWSNIAPATILTAFSTLVDQMRANNPNMKILVAQIIPMNPSTCSACAQRVVNFNAAIPAWASSKSTAQSPIIVVDQWTGFNTATDTYDGVHPNSAGDQKMSDRWYPALAALLGASPITPTSTSTPTRTPTPVTVTPTRTPTPVTVTPTRTPTPGAIGCAVTYTTNDWGSGFTGNITIKNNSAAAINNWTLAWTFPGNQRITNLWNGSLTQSGQAVAVANLSYNSSIAANGGTVSFGFNAEYSGSNPRPSAFTLNGTACTIAP